MREHKRTWVEISQSALVHNFRETRRRVPEGCKVLCVIKADAYGHGAEQVARLMEAQGCDYLAVACLDEAVSLRRAGVETPIMILGWTAAEYTRELAVYNITQAVGDLDTARHMSDAIRDSGLRVKIHLKLETGMGRTGFRAFEDSDLAAAAEAAALPGLIPEGVFTHFAVSDTPSDPFTALQFARFTSAAGGIEALTGIKFALRHCCASGGIVNFPQYSLDMVRLGVSLYGAYPDADAKSAGFDQRPAMEFKTLVGAVTEHLPGDTVSYGRTFTVQKPMRLAVLNAGYADGLRRDLSGRMDVLIRGRRAPQVGRICMDMCMADVTDIPGVAAGDTATIFGRDGGAYIPVEELSGRINTITYELLCAVSPRVKRVYVD